MAKGEQEESACNKVDGVGKELLACDSSQNKSSTEGRGKKMRYARFRAVRTAIPEKKTDEPSRETEAYKIWTTTLWPRDQRATYGNCCFRASNTCDEMDTRIPEVGQRFG
jgi:hypothetical protein